MFNLWLFLLFDFYTFFDVQIGEHDFSEGLSATDLKSDFPFPYLFAFLISNCLKIFLGSVSFGIN